MAIIAGIDEAGYGPVLGPLVITAIAFDVPEGDVDCPLEKLLKDAVTGRQESRKHRIAVMDSKRLYHARNGLKLLENAVFPFLRSGDMKVTTFRQLLEALSCCHTGVLDGYPWYAEKDYPLPLSTNIPAVLHYADLLKYVFHKQHVRFRRPESCVVAVKEFNSQVRLLGNNKASVLFQHCIRLVTNVWNSCDGRIKLTIDKHGGRDKYYNLLKGQFSAAKIKIVNESAGISHYRISEKQKDMEISFVEKGESRCLSVALASIFSKYIRELFIKLENQYWHQFLPDLKPTAGYYEDAQRFLSDIEHIRKREKIRDDILIRIK
ncbi:MAG: hypothetical protein ACUBOA_03660 [Candidatus Loosdrechtia sp.]|uniref:hypothetical protein n=1 Tax=Candidatus Loosdrechtia sp. TaxID=3101272 RepID=UPI003A617784|nr:MAG: hypothetical protein QY305_09740 [Candidatus Jettenia sp. AMX2]